MARPEQYPPEQWEYMNKPDTQVSIRETLNKYICSFLDTAPEGGEKSRALQVILMVKKYFERELRLAEEPPEDDERSWIAKQVLIPLGSYLNIDKRFQAGLDAESAEMPQSPEASPEELEQMAERWRRFEEWIRQEGKEHWWD